MTKRGRPAGNMCCRSRLFHSSSLQANATREWLGKFVDVEIVEVLTNSLRAKVVRTEDEMGLRIAESPESVISRTRKENDSGVGIYQP